MEKCAHSGMNGYEIALKLEPKTEQDDVKEPPSSSGPQLAKQPVKTIASPLHQQVGLSFDRKNNAPSSPALSG